MKIAQPGSHGHRLSQLLPSLLERSAVGIHGRVTGKQSSQLDPLPLLRAGAAKSWKLQQERSLTAWGAGGLAALRGICKYLSLTRFGSAVVHGAMSWGCLGNIGLGSRLLRLES